jgi:hypothetical protein
MSRRLVVVPAVLAGLALVPGLALAVASPTIGKESTSGLTGSSAVLHALVNPNGSSTVTYFQIGLTSAYGIDTAQLAGGSGTKAVDESVRVKGLLPGTTYHFRAVAENPGGTSLGADHSFRTTGNPPPAVATGSATAVSKSGGTVTGVVNPENQTTTYSFQYGLTTAYASGFTPSLAVPKGVAPVNVAYPLTGLQAGVEYHYRLVAQHGSVASYGADATFFTEPERRASPSLSAKTTPQRARRPPFRLTTTGVLRSASIFPPADVCTGTIKLRMFNGRRRVSQTFAALQPNCTYSDTVVLRRMPRHRRGTRTVRLKVYVYFFGNGYVAPRRARMHAITLG